jgi:hypothetical protein
MIARDIVIKLGYPAIKISEVASNLDADMIVKGKERVGKYRISNTACMQ